MCKATPAPVSHDAATGVGVEWRWEMGDEWEMISVTIRVDPPTVANFRYLGSALSQVNALISR